jgi:hypothetical protein
MAEQVASAPAVLGRLREALDQVANALAAANLEQLVAAEASLATVVAELPAIQRSTPADAATMRTEIDRARNALMRCRRLGTSLGEFARLSLRLHALGSGYDRTGQSPTAAPSHAVDARV